MLRQALLVCAAAAALTGCVGPYYQAAPPPPPPPPPAPLIIIIVGGDADAAAGVVEVEPAEAIAVEAPAAAPVVEAPARVVKVKPAPPPGPVPLAPQWRGTWKDREGHWFAFSLVLRQERGGRVEGYFDWRLVDAPAGSQLALHVNDTGRELVRGRYDPRSRRLELAGYQVSNPRLIAVDHYRIILDPHGGELQGLSRGAGDAWTASLAGRAGR